MSVLISYGKTTTGRQITGAFIVILPLLNIDEVLDCYALFTYLGVREKRKYGESDQYETYNKYVSKAELELKARGKFQFIRPQELIARGRRLANVEFREF